MLLDLAGGQLDFSIAECSGCRALARAVRLRLLAVASDKRIAVEPTTPTLQDPGYAEFFFVDWYGVFAPKDLPVGI